MIHYEVVDRLTLHEQFRLVEIAHETSNFQIREAALNTLNQQYLKAVQVNLEEAQK